MKKCIFPQVIAESLSEDEIAGLKELFKMLDTDNSGQITFEELEAGLKRVGANLKESEIYDLMQAVIIQITKILIFFGLNSCWGKVNFHQLWYFFSS